MALNKTKPKPPKDIFVISGNNGSGKTRLADLFPKPYFLNVENTGNLEFSQPHWSNNQSKTWSDIISAVKDFKTEEHEFKTLVIDSINACETLAINHIRARNNGLSNLAMCDGGYNGGYNSLHTMMTDLALNVSSIRSVKDCNIIWIIHSVAKEVELPGMPSFQQWLPSLTQTKSVDIGAIFKRECDNWLHIYGRYMVTDDSTDDSKNRRQIGLSGAAKRFIGIEETPTYFAKNRHGWTGSIEFERNGDTFIKKIAEQTKSDNGQKE